MTLAALVVLLIAGTAGYMLIEGWPLNDALYMTVITLTSVGFEEVHPLTEDGRIFTICLILIGAGVAAVLLSSIFEHVMSEEWRYRWRLRRRLRMIKHLKNHTIICGYGRMGQFIGRELVEEGDSLLFIEIDEETARKCERDGFDVLLGSGADEEILKQAGIAKAQSLIATANSDAENLFIVLTARELKESIQIIARAELESSESKLKRSGANRVILPYALGGQRIVSLIRRPGVADFLDVAMHSGELELRLEEMQVEEGSEVAGMSLADARARELHGVTVLAVRHPGRAYLTTPEATDELDPGSALIVLGTLDGLRDFAGRMTA